MKAIATLDNIPVVNEEEVTTTEEGFQIATKGERSIAIELEETLKPINPKRWAEAEKIVKVVDEKK